MVIGSAGDTSLLGSVLRNTAAQLEAAEQMQAEAVPFGRDSVSLSAQAENAAAGAETAVPVTHAASSNLMARNFYNSNYERSQYVTSSIEGIRNEVSYSQKMTSMVGTLSAQAAVWDSQRHFGDRSHPIENTYVNGNRLNTVTDMAMDRAKKDEETQSAKKNLDEIRDEIERKAQEATAPTNENGEVIETPSSGGTGETAQAPAPAPSAPDLPARAASADQVPVDAAVAAYTASQALSTPTSTTDLTV